MVENQIEFRINANNTITMAKAKYSPLGNNSFDKWDTYSMFSDDNEDLIEPYFVVEGKDMYYNIFNELPYIVLLLISKHKSNQMYS